MRQLLQNAMFLYYLLLISNEVSDSRTPTRRSNAAVSGSFFHNLCLQANEYGCKQLLIK